MNKTDVTIQSQIELKSIVQSLWDTINKQEWRQLSGYFSKQAVINWQNTNEKFTVDEFIIVNSEYPGDWNIKVKRMVQQGNLVISVAHVLMAKEPVSFYVTSFFDFVNGKIMTLNEYWGDNGEPPAWRIEKNIGSKIV